MAEQATTMPNNGAINSPERTSTALLRDVSIATNPRPKIIAIAFCTTMTTPNEATKTVKYEPSCRWMGT